jgi:hypothetical protein
MVVFCLVTIGTSPNNNEEIPFRICPTTADLAAPYLLGSRDVQKTDCEYMWVDSIIAPSHDKRCKRSAQHLADGVAGAYEPNRRRTKPPLLGHGWKERGDKADQHIHGCERAVASDQQDCTNLCARTLLRLRGAGGGAIIATTVGNRVVRRWADTLL